MILAFPEAIGRARRVLDSGRALFRENLVPECHAHLTSALAILLEAWAVHPGSETATASDPAVRALAALERAGYPGLDRLRAVALPDVNSGQEQTCRGPEPGRADLDVTWGEIERLYCFSVRTLDPPARRQRILFLAAAAAGLALVVLVVGLGRVWGRPVVTASAVYSPHHPAANAIDGMVATEWLLPDATTGWLQINYPSPRAVHAVRLLNAHNIHFQDRGTENVRVTAYCEQQAVAAADGRFAEIVAGPSPLDLSVSADCVTHIRVEVLSYFKTGGGLAEVEVR